MTQLQAIFGAQWGDEGKGKLTDFLTAQHDVVVRFQGGHNAGHTIWVGDKKYVLHLIPSGILHEKATSVIAHGVVVAPEALFQEITLLKESLPITPKRLKVSLNAPVITSYHRILDQAREKVGPTTIGTTGKGIGPCYEDKTGRRSLKMAHLLDQKELYKRLSEQLEEKAYLFEHLYKVSYPSLEEETHRLYEWGKLLAPYLCDTFSFLGDCIEQGQKILFEGAQGVLLDIDYGSYPFVTSSNTSIAGLYNGVGLHGHALDEVLGIAKAYVTRVGKGPFPTELFSEEGEILQRVGHEFGATTGRKRRCGWLDLPLLRYVIKTSHLTHLALTKLDVLAALSHIKVCYAYSVGEDLLDCAYPGLDLSTVTPLYKEFDALGPSFGEGEENIGLEKYLQFIEEQLQIPIKYVAYGPERNQLRMRDTLMPVYFSSEPA